MSDLDDLLAAVEERADDYTWPLLVIERASAELVALRASLSTATERIAALERCVEIADRVAIDADSIERYHEMNGCEEDAVNYSEPCPQCALKRNRDRYRAAREAVGR